MWRLALLLLVWLGPCVPMPARAANAADAFLTQANAALTGGQYDAARTLAASGLEEAGLEPLQRSRLMVTRGLAYQALGLTDEALMDFTFALRGDVLAGEERARALFARGLSLDGRGRLEAAIGDYTAALSFAPRAPYALNNRANVYRRQNRMMEAKRDYAAALEAATPNPQYPYFGLGQIAEAEGDVQTARNFYSRALTAAPDFALARERMLTLGAPLDMPAVPSDSGVSVLKPPAPRNENAPIILKRPPPADARLARPGAAKRPPSMQGALQTVQAPAGRGASLRPAIVEHAASQTSSGALVQLGAWRSESEARDGWEAAQKRADGLLDQVSPVIVRAEIPGRGVYFRLRVAANGNFSDFCATLAVKGLDCLPVRD